MSDQAQDADGGPETLARRKEWELAALSAQPEGAEEAQEAAEAAAEAAEAWLAAWAAEDWQALAGACQRRWLAHWREKVLEDEPDPLDRRLIGEGSKPEGPSWKEATGGTVAGLLEQLVGGQGTLTMHSVVKGESKVLSRVMVDVPARVVVRDRMGQRRGGTVHLRVLCETPADEGGEPTPDGEWGVNPVSAMRDL